MLDRGKGQHNWYVPGASSPLVNPCSVYLLSTRRNEATTTAADVKIQKDQVRLKALLESNCEPSNSDVFVCSFLLKLVCSCLLKEPRQVLYTKMY
jgi:hypothetical protein